MIFGFYPKALKNKSLFVPHCTIANTNAFEQQKLCSLPNLKANVTVLEFTITVGSYSFNCS